MAIIGYDSAQKKPLKITISLLRSEDHAYLGM